MLGVHARLRTRSCCAGRSSADRMPRTRGRISHTARHRCWIHDGADHFPLGPRSPLSTPVMDPLAVGGSVLLLMVAATLDIGSEFICPAGKNTLRSCFTRHDVQDGLNSRVGGIARQILPHLPYGACTSIPKHVHNSQLKRRNSFDVLPRLALEHNVFHSACIDYTIKCRYLHPTLTNGGAF
jgi:hypothetical protein